jgi:hypothetical protein
LAFAVSLFAKQAKSKGEKPSWSIEYGSMKYSWPGWSWLSPFNNGIEDEESSWIEVQTKCFGGLPIIWFAEIGWSNSSTKPLRWIILILFFLIEGVLFLREFFFWICVDAKWNRSSE